MMTPYQTIRQAIAEKRNIKAVYDGLERHLSPHVIGTNNEGREQTLCYQFGGESKSRPIEPDGSPNNWRCYDISKFSEVTFMVGNMHTAPNHSRPQTCCPKIDLEIKF